MSETKQPAVVKQGKVTANASIDWMSKNALDLLAQYARPPKSIEATITTEEGHTYKGVVHLVERQEDALPIHDGKLVSDDELTKAMV
jgi:hypothetical protein